MARCWASIDVITVTSPGLTCYVYNYESIPSIASLSSYTWEPSRSLALGGAYIFEEPVAGYSYYMRRRSLIIGARSALILGSLSFGRPQILLFLQYLIIHIYLH